MVEQATRFGERERERHALRDRPFLIVIFIQLSNASRDPPVVLYIPTLIINLVSAHGTQPRAAARVPIFPKSFCRVFITQANHVFVPLPTDVRFRREPRPRRAASRRRTYNSSMTTANKRRVRWFSLDSHKTRARLIASELPLRRVSLETRIPREPGEPREPRDPLAFSASHQSAAPVLLVFAVPVKRFQTLFPFSFHS